ncbi:zincin-like metallopeptidase toxin domain-containing protein [Roseimicrobium gellanilyticum]|nr:zincin-like metallopeptidase toxin domain-containing protein [Roseimicrobium gellanilyticum]
MKLFRTAEDAQITDGDIKEAWSHLGQYYFVGRAKHGDAATLARWKEKGFREMFADIMGSKAGPTMQAYETFFRSVWRRGAELEEMRRAGTLDGDLEGALRRSLGMGDELSSAPSPSSNSMAGEGNVDAEGRTLGENNGETSFAELPKQRQDKPGSWEEVKRGHTWNSAKKFLPKLKDNRKSFALKRGTWEVLVQRLAKWLGQMQKVSDPWGAKVLLANPQSKGRFADPMENRAAHLIGENDAAKTENRTLDPEKLDWIGSVMQTIADAQVRVTNGKETFYFRSYAEGVHMVIVEDGAVKDQYGVVTQYAPELSKTEFEGALVEHVRRNPGLAPQGGPGAAGIPTQPQSQTAQTPQPGAQQDTTTSEAGSQSMSLLPDVPNPSMEQHLNATSTGLTSSEELHNRIGKLRSVRRDRILGEMDAAPFRGTGNYGGILLTEGMLKAIETRIAELTPHGEAKWTLVRNSDTYLKDFTARAGFNPTTCQMHLRSDATYFDYFHELCHATMRAQLGSVEEYYKIREYDREMYVFDQIAKNEHRFTEEEIDRAIEDALHYYNKCGPRTHQYKIGK